MPAFPQITDAEWHVMKVLWESGPLTAGKIVEQVQEQQQWAPRTIKTLLARLVKKGAAAIAIEDRRYIYRARVSREACRRQESRSFLSRVFDGAVTPALVHFIKESNLSPQEIEHLKRILDQEAK